ncbi:FAD:protein FMN transferase [soil metagenome]
MKRRTWIGGAIGLGTLGLAGGLISKLAARPPQHKQDKLYTGAALAFGTTISIQVVHPDQQQAELAIARALDAARQIDQLMTLHREDSQVALLNRHGYLANPDPHLLTVLASAIRLSQLSHGAFDITVQPLWQTYSAAAKLGGLPDAAQRQAAMALVNWRALQVDTQHVRLLHPGMAITLNGIAQGYAVDVARASLIASGIQHALLDTGEFAARGRKNAQQEWLVGIRHPRDVQALADVVPMRGRCVATSGDYESSFTPDFSHHHIFDPASGDSPGELASVTVVAATGLQADGLSTAMMVLGAEKSLALAATLNDVDVLLIAKNGSQWRLPG